MKLFSLLLNPAVGGSFAYGAYQTMIVLKNSTEPKNNRETRRMINDQQRILKFWVVMICMLTITPIFDLIFGVFLGPIWSIMRMLIFWQVAYSRTLGSGWLFEQYELCAPFIEKYLLEIIIFGRQGRTLILDYCYDGLLKGFSTIVYSFIPYASRPVLMAVRVKIKEAHWTVQTELKKQMRPGHRRETSVQKGEGTNIYNDGVQMSEIRRPKSNHEKDEYLK